MGVVGITIDPNVVCPFYKYHESKNVICEGPVEQTTVVWQWKSGDDRKRQMEIYCYKYWKRCEIGRCNIANRNFDFDEE